MFEDPQNIDRKTPMERYFPDIRDLVGKPDKRFVLAHSKRLGRGELVSAESLRYGGAGVGPDWFLMSLVAATAVVAIAGSALYIKSVRDRPKK
jgi:hypothetical protein